MRKGKAMAEGDGEKRPLRDRVLRKDRSDSLLPMLIGGLVMIVIAMVLVMLFV